MKNIVNKKCPFCGRKPECMGGELANGTGFYWIRCKCGIEQLGYLSQKDAWSAWNRRKP